MKSIGIITIVKVNNYGAELQAFALQKKIEQLGYSSEIIDYIYYKNWRFHDTKESCPLIPMGNKARISYWIKYRLINFILDKIVPLFHKPTSKRLRRFDDFHKYNTRFSRSYRSMQQLYNTCIDYDIYVVGSDQVWNPAASSSIEPYFLTFAPKNTKKFSYASSFGVATIPSGIQERMATLLGNIDTISVREDSGITLVKQLTGKDALLVVDPTLLLTKEEWNNYMKPYPSMPRHYVLIYQLSESNVIVDAAMKIGRERNMPVYRICKRSFRVEKNDGVINILDAGPAEFLSLIAKADYLVTNSFHGTAFAVNFNIPFYTIVSSKKNNNSRMVSLLKLLDLSDRLVEEDICEDSIDPTKSIDFKKPNDSLTAFRNKSMTYLLSNIQN